MRRSERDRIRASFFGAWPAHSSNKFGADIAFGEAFNVGGAGRPGGIFRCGQGQLVTKGVAGDLAQVGPHRIEAPLELVRVRHTSEDLGRAGRPATMLRVGIVPLLLHFEQLKLAPVKCVVLVIGASVSAAKRGDFLQLTGNVSLRQDLRGRLGEGIAGRGDVRGAHLNFAAQGAAGCD